MLVVIQRLFDVVRPYVPVRTLPTFTLGSKFRVFKTHATEPRTPENSRAEHTGGMIAASVIMKSGFTAW